MMCLVGRSVSQSATSELTKLTHIHPSLTSKLDLDEKLTRTFVLSSYVFN